MANRPKEKRLKDIFGASVVIEQDFTEEHPVHLVNPVKKIRRMVSIKIDEEPLK
jgi:hypothetical protein